MPNALRVDRLAVAQNSFLGHQPEAGRELTPDRRAACARPAGTVPQRGDQGLAVTLHRQEAISNLSETQAEKAEMRKEEEERGEGGAGATARGNQNRPLQR